MSVKFSNEDVVLSLIKKATEYEHPGERGIQGRKALQKSLYLLNQRHKMFSFRWADYGPFCWEIQGIVDDLVTCETVTVSDIPTGKEGAVIKNMKSSRDCPAGFNLPPEVDGALDRIVEFIAGKTPRQLELLASVHFLATRQMEDEPGYSADYVFEWLSQLKPEAGFLLDDVAGSIKILEANSFLKA